MASMMDTISEGFGPASLRGQYSMVRVGQGGAHQSAGVGVYRFDGSGGWTGEIIANIPGPVFGMRSLARGAMRGTYSMHESGSGYGSTSGTITLQNGGENAFTATLLITRATMVDGVAVAEDITLLEDDVDPITGCIHINYATRQPDAGTFSLASFSGTYGGPGVGHGGLVPSSAIGIGAVNFHGDGVFTAVDIQNLPADHFLRRQNMTFDTENGRYDLNRDGLGRIMVLNPQDEVVAEAQLVVTRAVARGELKVAMEYFFVTNDTHAPTGNLVTTRVSKRMPL